MRLIFDENAFDKQDNSCVILFAKAPEKGFVKTRLARTLGEDTTLRLYQCFVSDVMKMLKTEAYDFRTCFCPRHSETMMKNWLGKAHPLFPQRGKDIGERMANAFYDTFADGIRHALLIGTDIPDLPGKIIHEAFEQLENNDAVIGPAEDGGYYLIGFNADTFLPDIFQDMPWGTGDVFEKTLGVFRKNQRRVHALPTWRDIDTYEDLLVFVQANSGKAASAEHTLGCLARMGFIPRQYGEMK